MSDRSQAAPVDDWLSRMRDADDEMAPPMVAAPIRSAERVLDDTPAEPWLSRFDDAAPITLPSFPPPPVVAAPPSLAKRVPRAAVIPAKPAPVAAPAPKGGSFAPDDVDHTPRGPGLPERIRTWAQTTLPALKERLLTDRGRWILLAGAGLVALFGLTLLMAVLAWHFFFRSSKVVESTAPVTPPRTLVIAAKSDDLIVGDQPGQARTIGEAIATARPGSIIRIRPGTYTEKLVIDKQLSLIGDGGMVTLSSATGCVLTIKAENVTIRDLTLVRKEGVSEAAVAAVEVSGNGTRLENCSIQSRGGVGLSVRGGNASATITHCQVRDGSAAGVVIGDGAQVTVDHSEFSGHAEEAIRVSTEANAVLRHCVIENNQTSGVIVKERGELTIEDGTLRQNRKAQIRIEDGSRVSLRSTRLIEGSTFGIDVSPLAEVEVEGGVIYGHAQSGVLSRGGRVTLRGVKIFDNLNQGVSLIGHASARIDHTEIRGSGDTNLFVADEAIPVVTETQIRGANVGIICTRKGSGLFTLCEITGARMDGVRTLDAATPTFHDCKIHQNREAGFYAGDNGRGTFDQCTFASNGQNGIFIGSGADPLFRGCQVNDHPGHAIIVTQQSQATLERCMIRNAGFSGIKIVNSAAATLRGGSIQNCKGNAIELHPQTRASLSNVELGMAQMNLVVAKDAFLEIAGGNLHDSNNSAIALTGQSIASLTGCEIHKCGGGGLEVKDGSDLTLARCGVLNNKAFGVSIKDTARCTITESTFRGQQGTQILAGTRESVAIRGGIIEGGKSYGFFATLETRAVLTGVKFTDQTMADVVVEDKAFVHLQKCEITKSKDKCLQVMQTGQCTVTECIFKDSLGVSVQTEGTGIVTLHRCLIENGSKGAGFAQGGRIELQDSKVVGQMSDALVAGNGAEVIVRRTRIEKNLGHGMVARAKGRIVAEGGTIDGNSGAGILFLNGGSGIAEGVVFDQNRFAIQVDRGGIAQSFFCKSTRQRETNWSILPGGRLTGNGNLPEIVIPVAPSPTSDGPAPPPPVAPEPKPSTSSELPELPFYPVSQ